ncbi:MAG: sensor histidine kinase [Limisphaerales bacterium]
MAADSFTEILAAQQQLLLVREEDERFRIIGREPVWWSEIHEAPKEDAINITDWFPFLSVFLEEAEELWQGEIQGGLESDLWVEETLDHHATFHLRAQALLVGDQPVLSIQPMEKVYRRIQQSLQRGRTELTHYRRRSQEHDFKETMIHCLVHDLVGSLSVAEIIFRQMQERDDLTLQEESALGVGRNAMHSVSSQLRSMVDVFSAELKSVEHYETDPDFAPDILDCVMVELVSTGPALRAKKIQIQNEIPDDPALRWPVVGDRNKLQRIVFNLLENALRHSPSGGTIRVRVGGNKSHSRVAIDDEGPGVPEDQAGEIFKRFASDKRRGGKSGLGLFFARMMIDRWGGQIGQEKSDLGGASFWFELPRAREDEGSN